MDADSIARSQEMIRLFMAFIPARAIYLAAKLDIADALAHGPKDARTLAAELHVDASALARVLRILVCIGVLDDAERGAFALTPLGDTLRGDFEASVRDYLQIFHDLHYPSVTNLIETVRAGAPVFRRLHDGKSVFEFLQSNPDVATTFQMGLANRSRIDHQALLQAYDFSACRRVVDVGGGHGALLSAILERYPQIDGVLFDQPPALAAARAGRGGPLPRCELVPGDFFKEVPAGADTYIVKLVLHDWSDKECMRILANCRRAMDRDARLLVVEGLIGASDRLTLTHQVDIVMLASYTGKERSESEFRELFERVGLTLARAIPTASELHVLEARAA